MAQTELERLAGTVKLIRRIIKLLEPLSALDRAAVLATVDAELKARAAKP